MQSAGHWLVQPGKFYPSGGREVSNDELAAAAVEEAAASGGWCKIVSDWMPHDVPIPVQVLTEAVAAVHATGGRVALHAQTEQGCDNAVMAGATASNTACTWIWPAGSDGRPRAPSWCPRSPHSAEPGNGGHAEPSEFRDWVVSGWEGLLPIVRAAYEAGVIVLAGTDCMPFGNVATEVKWLVRPVCRRRSQSVPRPGQRVTGWGFLAGFPAKHRLIW